MVTTFRARYDGQVFHPEGPVDLNADETYTVTIEAEVVDEREPDDNGEYVLTKIARLAVDMGVDDFADRHDWYALHGLPNPAKNG